MIQRYMLDTNIFSELVKNPTGQVAERLANLEKTERARICISIVVAAETRFGIAKKGSHNLSRQVAQILGVTEILPLEAGVDAHYAQVRLAFERVGRPIGANDLFIAAHALATDSILVTNNTGEFSRIEGLRVENWMTSADEGGPP